MRLTDRGHRALATTELIIGRGVIVLLSVIAGLFWTMCVHLIRSGRPAVAAIMGGMWLVAVLPALLVHAHQLATKFDHRTPPRRVWIPFTLAGLMSLTATVVQVSLGEPQDPPSVNPVALALLIAAHTVAFTLATVIGIRFVSAQHPREDPVSVE